MNGVLGLTELLLATKLDAQQRSLLETLRGSGEALLAIVNDILDLSKIEAGRLEVEAIDFDVVQSVEDVVQLLAPRAQAMQIELTYHVDAAMPPATRGDPFRFRQVLMNLVTNALKFTPAGSVAIDVALASGTSIRVSVSDTGIGISAADLARLFKPFEQADSSTTRRYGGSGLGLAICRQLVELMGGTIGVESAPGRGSHFWFELPLVAVTSVPQVTHPIALTGRRLLVVDDDATHRLLFEHQARAARMHCRVAASAEQALQCLRDARRRGEPFDAALIDAAPFGADARGPGGFELARALRAEPGSGALALLLTTTGYSREQMGQARAAGINAYLLKPVQRQVLYRAIEGALHATPDCDLPIPLPKVSPRIRARVLLAEDNPVNQLVATHMLDSLGCEYQLVEDGRQALAAMRAGGHDLVLMDGQMPVLDGYEATREFRAWEQTRPGHRRVPIIALTANALLGDADACRAAGMDDYLAKPYTREQLGNVIARWMPVQSLHRDTVMESDLGTLLGPLEAPRR
jgi:two-component system, sensor histidine kinase and response regulator